MTVQDINPSAMRTRGGYPAQDGAPNARAPLAEWSDAQLADEHRGRRFARDSADERLKAIEAEMVRRGHPTFRGKLALTTRHENGGLVDLERLRKERPDICREFVRAGSGIYFRSRTLRPDERS